MAVRSMWLLHGVQVDPATTPDLLEAPPGKTVHIKQFSIGNRTGSAHTLSVYLTDGISKSYVFYKQALAANQLLTVQGMWVIADGDKVAASDGTGNNFVSCWGFLLDGVATP